MKIKHLKENHKEINLKEFKEYGRFHTEMPRGSQRRKGKNSISLH